MHTSKVVLENFALDVPRYQLTQPHHQDLLIHSETILAVASQSMMILLTTGVRQQQQSLTG